MFAIFAGNDKTFARGTFKWMLKLNTDHVFGLFSGFSDYSMGSLVLTLRLRLCVLLLQSAITKHKKKIIYKKECFYKNGGPEEDQGFLCVRCESLKLDKIGLLNLGEYWFRLYSSRKSVSPSPSLLHMVAQFTFAKSLPNAIDIDKWD